MWIEISHDWCNRQVDIVTPFTGVWIEIHVVAPWIRVSLVTPFTGVWIEIVSPVTGCKVDVSHSLHGSVD